MLNKVDLRSSNYMFSERSTGDLMVKHGSERIPDMMPSRTFSLATKPFNIDSIIDKYYTGAKVKDKLQGVWLRFYRKDTLVFEWKSPGLPKMEWSGGAHKSSPKVEIAKNDAPSNKSSGVKPASTDGKVVEKDDDAGEIVKIFELEEGMTMKK
jgi:hypothetical protein